MLQQALRLDSICIGNWPGVHMSVWIEFREQTGCHFDCGWKQKCQLRLSTKP
jgi:hypothetical protein